MNEGLCIHRKQPKVLHSEARRLVASPIFYFIYNARTPSMVLTWSYMN